MTQSTSNRPDFFTLHNGDKAPLPFSDQEYENRLRKLRTLMANRQVDAMLLTSMHNIAYYSGFLYCSFGRPYACVVTADQCVTVSANIDLGQPWRRCYGDNVIYTDWQRNNYYRALNTIIGANQRVGIEADHLSLAARDTLVDLKKLLSDMRKQIVLAQSTEIDDTQRAIHADTFDQLLGQLNLKVRSSGGISDNLIGSSIRDVFTPGTLTYKTKPDSPVDQTVTGIFSGSDFFITDGNGDKFYPGIFGATLIKFPTDFGDEGELVSDTDTVDYDSVSGAISLTRDGEGSPYLSGTLERKGLGVLNSFLYGNFTDAAKRDEALADLDAASATLRFNITIIETQLTKVTAHRDFNAGLIEEHRALATNVKQQEILDQQTKALEEQKITLKHPTAPSNPQLQPQRPQQVNIINTTNINNLYIQNPEPLNPILITFSLCRDRT